jgi:hypothetical protein
LDLRERIAFELWNDTNPAHLRADIRVGNLGEIVTPMGGGWVGRHSLALDWKLNRPAFLRRAGIALAALDAHDEEDLRKAIA